MHADKRKEAERLRRKGFSQKEISRKIGIPKGTISAWVRLIQLSPFAKQRIAKRVEQNQKKLPKAMREARIVRWTSFRKEAEQEFTKLSKSPAFMFGLGLYTGEGDKRGNSSIGLINYDPTVIRAALRFFQLINDKKLPLKIAIHLPPGLVKASALRFWLKVTCVPSSSCKIYRKVSKNSRGKRIKRWPFGGCKIMIHSTRLKQKLDCWRELALSLSSNG